MLTYVLSRAVSILQPQGWVVGTDHMTHKTWNTDLHFTKALHPSFAVELCTISFLPSGEQKYLPHKVAVEHSLSHVCESCMHWNIFSFLYPGQIPWKSHEKWTTSKVSSDFLSSVFYSQLSLMVLKDIWHPWLLLFYYFPQFNLVSHSHGIKHIGIKVFMHI